MQGELSTRNHLSWRAIADSIECFRFVVKLVRPTATVGHESNEHQKLIRPLESFYGLANIASETLSLGRKQDEFLKENFCNYSSTGVLMGLIAAIGTLLLVVAACHPERAEDIAIALMPIGILRKTRKVLLSISKSRSIRKKGRR
jgi:hypothetical protein